MPLTNTQKNKIKRFIRIKKNPDIALMRELEELLDELKKTAEKSIQTEITNLQGRISDVIDQMESEIDTEREQVIERYDRAIDKTVKEIKTDLKRINIKDVVRSMPELEGKRGPQGPKGEKGEPGKDGSDGEDGKDGKDGTEIEPSEIVDKLESLSGDDRLSVNAIKGLIEFINEKYPETPTMRGAGGGGSSMVMNESLGTGDGSETEFTLQYPPKSGTVQIFVGAGILFEDDDFTRSGKTITLNNAPPPGAKVRATYAK